MAKVITLLSVKFDYIEELLTELRKIKAVKHAHICAGDFDIVAELELNEDGYLRNLDRVLFGQIQDPFIKWINRTVTVIMLPMEGSTAKKGTGEFRIYSFLNVELGFSKKVSRKALELDGVIEAYTAIGPFDVVVISQLKDARELQSFIMGRILTMRHVQKSTTLLTLAA